jgi:hypothetical protein
MAIEHLFERASVARELHAAGMLLRRGIGRVSVEEACVFANADTRFMRPDPNGALVTTREVFAEETAMIETALAGHERCEAIGSGKGWTISSPIVAQSEEVCRAISGVHRCFRPVPLVSTLMEILPGKTLENSGKQNPKMGFKSPPSTGAHI